MLRSLLARFPIHVALAVALAGTCAPAHAQDSPEVAAWKQAAQRAPDLTNLPIEAGEPSLFMRAPALVKPAGNGPFPTLLVVHSCGGVRSEIFDWARRAAAQGYAAMVIDSLGPRSLKSNCMPGTVVPLERGVRDAFQALDHLRTVAVVDKDRIGLIGFSWGAIVGELVSSAQVAGAMSPNGARFQAAVSLYPMCFYSGSPSAPANWEFLRQDVDRPLLVLMGGEDVETPASDCLPRLEKLKAANAPVEWHLYPDATHCWDCLSINGFRKTDFKGTQVVYRYSKDTTEDSAKRAFEFFARNLGAKN